MNVKSSKSPFLLNKAKGIFNFSLSLNNLFFLIKFIHINFKLY